MMLDNKSIYIYNIYIIYKYIYYIPFIRGLVVRKTVFIELNETLVFQGFIAAMKDCKFYPITHTTSIYLYSVMLQLKIVRLTD